MGTHVPFPQGGENLFAFLPYLRGMKQGDTLRITSDRRPRSDVPTKAPSVRTLELPAPLPAPGDRTAQNLGTHTRDVSLVIKIYLVGRAFFEVNTQIASQRLLIHVKCGEWVL